MKTIKHITTSLSLVAALGLSSSGAFAVDEDYIEQISSDEFATLSKIETDREGLVRTLASSWAMQLNEEESTLLSHVNSLSDKQLLLLKEASTTDEARKVLAGLLIFPFDPIDPLDPVIPIIPFDPGIIGPVVPLQLDVDLVYRPVVPCRIIDTNNAGGDLAAYTTRPYVVHGSATAITAQGGNTSGCPAPKGEPYSAHINFTVVPSGTSGTGKGNIRVYPYLSVEPAASLLNFTFGTNIANAATIKTCQLCGSDINIKAQHNSTRVIADVMGYYYPIDETSSNRVALGFASYSSTGLKNSGTNNMGAASWNTTSKWYEITIANETYNDDDYSAVVSATNSGCADNLGSVDEGTSGKLRVRFLDVEGIATGTYQQCNFNVVVYKE